MQRLLELQLLHVAAALLDLVLRIAELDAAAHAVEERGRDGRIALGGKAVRHRADVAVHAEDLLQHHYGAARLAGGAAR